MDTSVRMQSTTCATVSPATNSGGTRRITREESRPGTTPCPLGGAALASGKKTASSWAAMTSLSVWPETSEGVHVNPFSLLCVCVSNTLSHLYRMKSHCEVSNALKKWHIAYHGTSVGALRHTLDHSQLLPGREITGTPFLYSHDNSRHTRVV